ncbi:MAG: hypothetical protein CL886_07570 [Dehalococcoidia bacterium]|nr:hypothetical protein [Dehalococcoidia bacterium]
MPEIKIVLSGYTFNSDQTGLGLSTVALIEGEVLTLVDVAHFGRRVLLKNALEDLGLALEDIGRVILTHAHWDHSQNTDLFPSAEIVIHAKELEYSKTPRPSDHATARYFSDTLSSQKVVEVEGETVLEPGVKIIETPGHTRGHISVVVDTHNGPVCIGGDAFSDAGALYRGTPALVFWSESEARQSIRDIISESSIIYPGHDRPFKIIHQDQIEYLVESPSIKFTGVLDQMGSTFSFDVSLSPNRGTTVQPEAND